MVVMMVGVLVASTVAWRAEKSVALTVDLRAERTAVLKVAL